RSRSHGNCILAYGSERDGPLTCVCQQASQPTDFSIEAWTNAIILHPIYAGIQRPWGALMGIHLRDLASWARNRKFIAGALVGLTLSIGILIGTVISGRVNATHSFLPSGAAPLEVPNPVSLSNAFGAIVERDEPAVVNISTTQVIDRKGQPKSHGGSADPFHDFFNRFFDSPNEGPEAERSL